MSQKQNDFSKGQLNQACETIERLGKPHVLMMGPGKSVHGGISAVVNSLYEAGLDERVELRYISTMEDGSKVRKLIRAIGAFFQFLPSIFWADILHVNMAADASFFRKKVFVDLAGLLKRKIVIHEHGGNFFQFYYETSGEKQKEIIQKTLRKADRFLVLSEAWKAFFEPITNQTIEVLHNGTLLPDKTRENFSDHNLIFLGRICRDKGIRELLLAMDIVHTSVPDATLFLGGSYEDPSLQKMVEERVEYVEFLGWIDEETREDYLVRKASVFVLPSYYEGQPISLLEAMAAGCVCVATKVGGIPEMITDGENGILLDAPHGEGHEAELTEAVAKALIEILAAEERKKALAQNALRTVREEYSIEKVVERLNSIYWEL